MPYCGKCQAELSEGDAFCRKCGSPVAGPSTPPVSGTGPTTDKAGLGCCLGCAGLALLILVSAISSSGGDSGSGSGSSSRESANTDAWVMAQDFVRAQLKAPATADFGGISDYQDPDQCVSRTGNEFLVTGWVDAENSFGAKIRNDFVVRMIRAPDGVTFNLKEIHLVPR